MRVNLQPATVGDVDDLISLRVEVNRHLSLQYGEGYWIAGATQKGTLFAMRISTVFIARHRGKVIATLALSTRKPWAIDRKYFSPSTKPLYLTAMAVDPLYQRQGVGRQCIEEARKIAFRWPSDAIRLDAYDAEAGAGEFYGKCGFREVGRAVYRKAPLIYYETPIDSPAQRMKTTTSQSP
jgi:GNAT superfamily N-acetyltransferase